MAIIPGSRERNLVSSVDFTIGAEAADAINVAVQLNGTGGVAITEAVTVLAYLSDAATGLVASADAPSGGTAAGATGSIIIELAAQLVFLLQTSATGNVELDITEAAGDTWYLVVVLPNGSHAVSGAITFAA